MFNVAYIIIILIVLAMVCLIYKKMYKESIDNSYIDKLNDKFKNNMQYAEYTVLANDRDPITYLELKQIYRKNKIITEQDVENIKKKYSNF